MEDFQEILGETCQGIYEESGHFWEDAHPGTNWTVGH